MSSFIFFIVIPNPVINIQVFALTSVLGALSYAILFTLMSAIAVKAKSNNTLVAVLGFPILIPMMIFITKATASAMRDPFLTSETIKNLSLIAALDIVQIILAVILFPYIWRE
jgi:heme exporter protein B